MALKDNLEATWDQLEDEPDIWFTRFSRYYLPLGPGRTLLKAYQLWWCDEHPAEELRRRNSATDQWSDVCKVWSWRERAAAHDQETYDFALSNVVLARNRILESVVAAADALVASLSNPRLAVAAAKEILDRGGLPSVQTHSISIEAFTADEFAAASEEVKEWEQKIHGKSG